MWRVLLSPLRKGAGLQRPRICEYKVMLKAAVLINSTLDPHPLPSLASARLLRRIVTQRRMKSMKFVIKL